MSVWTDLPEDLWFRVERTLQIGSVARAREDAVRYIAKSRLLLMRAEDHYRYVELESIRMVEHLRAFRDEYRKALVRPNQKSVAEIHWRVFRFGVMEIATYVLRRAVSEYLESAAVPLVAWELLFDPELYKKMTTSNASEELEKRDQRAAIGMEEVAALLPLTVFDQFQRGGPFGPEAQVRMAHGYPGMAPFEGKTFPQMLRDRQLLWAKSQPWVEGLSRLFDSVQEELSFQRGELGIEGRRADAALAELSPFEKVAFKYLSEFRSPQRSRSRHGHERWLSLVRELDERSIGLDAELPVLAIQQLRSLRKKGHVLNGWEEAYLSKARTSLENAKSYVIRRTVTHAIQNAADRASLRLG